MRTAARRASQSTPLVQRIADALKRAVAPEKSPEQFAAAIDRDIREHNGRGLAIARLRSRTAYRVHPLDVEEEVRT